MKFFKKNTHIAILLLCVTCTSCKVFAPLKKKWDDTQKDLVPVPTLNDKPIPTAYTNNTDTTNIGSIKWSEFFADKNLTELIDSALKNNYEVLMNLQEIEIAKNAIQIKHSRILPNVSVGGAIGYEKVGIYTSQGAGDASAEITPGHKVPEFLGDYFLGARASWEVDVWHKLRNAKKAAITHYLATIEGKNFLLTSIVAEIANSYYELLSLDNQLDIIRETIRLQNNALEIVRVQKEAARATELAVKKFEAEVLNSQSLEFDILQKIKEAENRINSLLGRYPQPIVRDKGSFNTQLPQRIKEGIPAQLLNNRPDIKQAELELFVTDCNVKIAKAEFFPSVGLTGAFGLQAFKPRYLVSIPKSVLFGLAGDVAGPIINRTAIKMEFNNAKAEQLMALYNYQKAILAGYMEVNTELSNIQNLEKFYDIKNKEVETLVKAIDVSNDLFKSARADYFEVLMTQRDALESKLELIEAKKRQFMAVINVYRALGGGWR
ncbi:MAG: efflux transporter outer membrane subunit [Saprospiraceae bacterium]|nr:efflux transporter outer membrane subunit [Saprospiraceae bacterium]